MQVFREGEGYHRLQIAAEDGPNITFVFGYLDYEEAAVSIVVEGVNDAEDDAWRSIVLERDLLITAIIQGWNGEFKDVHADETPESELGQVDVDPDSDIR